MYVNVVGSFQKANLHHWPAVLEFGQLETEQIPRLFGTNVLETFQEKEHE
jgi:hypothetical protein